MDLQIEMEDHFDPSDTDNAQQVAYKLLNLMKLGARVLREAGYRSDDDASANRRLGRDTSTDLSAAIQESARVLGLPTETGEEVQTLFKALEG